MRRRFKTEGDIARFVKQGFGQGEGSSYMPWHRVQDVPSRGRSRKAVGTKTRRTHHFLSDLEYHYFLLLEFSDEVIDIREQYPLLATARARDIAADMGIQYPVYIGTQLPYVLTSDFVVTLKSQNGKKRLAVRTCKYEAELDDPNRGQRTVEKLDLERAIWADQGVVDWKIVTEQLMNPILKDNLEWLHKAALVDQVELDVSLRQQFITVAIDSADGVRTLSSIVRSASTAIGLPNRIGTVLFKRLVWEKSILMDIVNCRLDPTLPCPRLSPANSQGASTKLQRAA